MIIKIDMEIEMSRLKTQKTEFLPLSSMRSVDSNLKLHFVDGRVVFVFNKCGVCF
ncbi:MAG: hypothetical protein PHE93_06355 [Clostridia bacterium]|nr:hypothetical protein [Clostridia bacterium]